MSGCVEAVVASTLASSVAIEASLLAIESAASQPRAVAEVAGNTLAVEIQQCSPGVTVSSPVVLVELGNTPVRALVEQPAVDVGVQSRPVATEVSCGKGVKGDKGDAGDPGPAQIFRQATLPSPSPGVVKLTFLTGQYPGYPTLDQLWLTVSP